MNTGTKITIIRPQDLHADAQPFISQYAERRKIFGADKLNPSGSPALLIKYRFRSGNTI